MSAKYKLLDIEEVGSEVENWKLILEFCVSILEEKRLDTVLEARMKREADDEVARTHSDVGIHYVIYFSAWFHM